MLAEPLLCEACSTQQRLLLHAKCCSNAVVWFLGGCCRRSLLFFRASLQCSLASWWHSTNGSSHERLCHLQPDRFPPSSTASLFPKTHPQKHSRAKWCRSKRSLVCSSLWGLHSMSGLPCTPDGACMASEMLGSRPLKSDTHSHKRLTQRDRTFLRTGAPCQCCAMVLVRAFWALIRHWLERAASFG